MIARIAVAFLLCTQGCQKRTEEGPRKPNLWQRLAPESAFDSLSALVFEQAGIVSDTSCHDSTCIDPDLVLLSRRGNCTGITAVAARIADSLGLPVKVALLPNHVFLGWPRVDVNWEPNARGISHPYGYYQFHYGLENKPGRNGQLVLPSRMPWIVQRELVAVMLTDSVAMQDRTRLANAESTLRQVIDSIPGWVHARGDLAVVLAAQGKRDEARQVLLSLQSEGVEDPRIGEGLRALSP